MDIPVAQAEPLNALLITMPGPTTYHDLVLDILRTVTQGQTDSHDINVIYKDVQGPIDEMHGIDIGDIIIEYHYLSS